ncbi:hypothetical protein QQG55_55620 [Brugia pahangi]
MAFSGNTVVADDELSCQLYQLARYEFLTHMITYVYGLKLKYQPRQFLIIRFVGNIKTIHNFIYESIILENYQPMLAIKAVINAEKFQFFLVHIA